MLDELESTKKGIEGYNWKAVAAEYAAEREQIEENAWALLDRSKRVKVSPEVKLYFDERRSERFGDALEGLLELVRGGRKREETG